MIIYKLIKYIIVIIVFNALSIGIFYINLKPWQKAWLLNRVNLFISVPDEYYNKYLFAVPDQWVSKSHFGEIKAKVFIDNRNTGYLGYGIGVQGEKYWSELSLVNDLESTAIEAESKRKKLNQSSEDRIIEYIKISVGFLPIIESKYKYREGKILDRNNIELPIIKNKCSGRKILIALPGSRSSPNAVMGLMSDYSSGFGRYWSNVGYCVYSLSIGEQVDHTVNFPRLGLSLIGADIAKIEDLIKYIRFVHGHDAHLVIAGISYGAVIAEIAGTILTNIDGIVSIGGSARYDYLISEFSHAGKNGKRYQNIWLENFLSSKMQYKLILNKGSKLLISIGSVDSGQWGDSGQDKYFFDDAIFNKEKKKGNYKFLIFKGVHESNPTEEINAYEKMLNGGSNY
jgi:hypothetical protein